MLPEEIPRLSALKQVIANDDEQEGGGGSGIRPRDRVAPIHAFQACAFDRSATPPSHLAAPRRAAAAADVAKPPPPCNALAVARRRSPAVSRGWRGAAYVRKLGGAAKSPGEIGRDMVARVRTVAFHGVEVI